MKMEIDVLCILQNIVYGYFFITSFYIQLLLNLRSLEADICKVCVLKKRYV